MEERKELAVPRLLDLMAEPTAEHEKSALDYRRFEDKLVEDGKKFDDKLAADGRRFEDKLAADGKKFEEKLAADGRKFEEQLAVECAGFKTELAAQRDETREPHDPLEADAEELKKSVAHLEEKLIRQILTTQLQM